MTKRVYLRAMHASSPERVLPYTRRALREREIRSTGSLASRKAGSFLVVSKDPREQTGCAAPIVTIKHYPIGLALS